MSSVMDEHYVSPGAMTLHPVSLEDEIKITNLRSGSWVKCDCLPFDCAHCGQRVQAGGVCGCDPCSPHTCPECVAGKCGNCDGAAWCNKRDGLTHCDHSCRKSPDLPTTERQL